VENSTSVRLACLKHAASVSPEPGSNSTKKFDIKTLLKICLANFVVQKTWN